MKINVDRNFLPCYDCNGNEMLFILLSKYWKLNGVFSKRIEKWNAKRIWLRCVFSPTSTGNEWMNENLIDAYIEMYECKKMLHRSRPLLSQWNYQRTVCTIYLWIFNLAFKFAYIHSIRFICVACGGYFLWFAISIFYNNLRLSPSFSHSLIHSLDLVFFLSVFYLFTCVYVCVLALVWTVCVWIV